MGNLSEIWNSVNQSLPVYRNDDKLDTLIGRIWGQLITSITVSEGQDSKGSAKLNAKTGVLAKLFGIELGGEVGVEKGKNHEISHAATLTYDNKLAILREYGENFRHIDTFSGLELFPSPNTPPKNWDSAHLCVDNVEFIGYMNGVFSPKRLVAGSDDVEDFVKDNLNRATSLWLMDSVKESAERARIGWIPRNFNLESQDAIVHLSFACRDVGYVALNAFGLVRCDNGLFECDPLTISLLGRSH